MLDLSLIKVSDVARILLLEDHEELDPAHLGNDWNGNVDEAEEQERTEDEINVLVTFSQIASDECSAFPNAEIHASSTLNPGENDAYRSGMVMTFDEIDGIHSVILSGNHSGSGNSDESHEGYFSGTMTIVPLARRDEALAREIRSQRKEELEDMADRLSQIVRSLEGYRRDEVENSGLWRRICDLNRTVAGS